MAATVPGHGTVLNSVNRVKVYNLSSVELPEGAISVAALGPKFVPFTKSDPETTKTDILNFSRLLLLKERFHGSTYTDESLVTPTSNYIPKSTKSAALKGLIGDLERFSSDAMELERSNVKDNLTDSQRSGLNFLKTCDNLLYFEADKGSGVVFLDADFYKDLVLEKLNSPNFEKLATNVDYFTNTKLLGFTRKHSQCLTPKEKRAITGFDYRSTNIYGVPKIHKSNLIKEALKTSDGVCVCLKSPSDLSLRIIFGGDHNPTVVLADLVDVLLKPFLGLVKSRVRDVTDFITRIPHFGVAEMPHIQMWSVDVKDMYQNIEHDLGLIAIEYWIDRYPEKLQGNKTKQFLLEALIFVLKNNTGYFNGEFYKQTRGTATGIKPAPSYADLVMGYLEINLFGILKSEIGNEVADFFWRFYRRFLDDGQIMWDTRLCDFELVFNRMNLLHPSIEFTSECSDTSLVYLNVTVLKTKTGFKTEIFNKLTDSDTYLPFTSSHPRHCRENIPFGLARSVRALTDDNETVVLKLEELRSKLERCKYPQGLVATAIQSAMVLNKDELRQVKDTEPSLNEIAFVHQYDPSLPQLFPLLKEYTSRLYTSRDLKPIFEGTRIINSQREPLSLGRLLQHSRFNDPERPLTTPGSRKCGMACALCRDILEVNSFYFCNSGIDFEIRARMDCTSRNLIYTIQCKHCSLTYIGETVNLRNRMSKHRFDSSSPSRASQEVSRHLSKCERGFWVIPIYKVQKENTISRLVIEDKLIKMLKPDLNRDQRNILQLQ